MDVMLVLEHFTLLSGLAEEEAKTWLPLCHWAVASLFGKLDQDTDLVANHALLCYAAGAMAYYKYVLRNASREGTTSFSAGDVKVTENTHHSATLAKQLYEDAVQSVAHLFAADDFQFMGVSFS